jgi:hypothetical protein
MTKLPVPPPVSFIQANAVPAHEAAAAAFLSFSPEYFKDKVYLLHEIKKKIATRFSIETQNVCVCGSAQFRYSYIKKREFSNEDSDLDLAIISPRLFSKYYSVALYETDGFKDLTKFNDQTESSSFFSYVSRRGMLRPDMLPNGPEKITFQAFFRKLSSEYREHFKSINCAIYLNEAAFIFKQVKCIEEARGI